MDTSRRLRGSYPERMPNRYTSLKDLMDRLDNTYCRYRDQVVYVRVQSEEQLALLDPKCELNLYRIEPHDPEFDISAIEVGYFNYLLNDKYHVVRAVRGPEKSWKSALSRSQIGWKSIDNDPCKIYVENTVWTQQGFTEMLTDTRMTLEEGLDKLKKSDEVAINRDIALQMTATGVVNVFHSGTALGWITPKSDKITCVDRKIAWVLRDELLSMGLSVS